jgi:hypothetical protein
MWKLLQYSYKYPMNDMDLLSIHLCLNENTCVLQTLVSIFAFTNLTMIRNCLIITVDVFLDIEASKFRAKNSLFFCIYYVEVFYVIVL